MAIIRQMGGYDEELDAEGNEKTMAPALLPKSVLGGKRVEPGDKLILRIDKVLEDEIAVSYASGASVEEEPEEPEDETAEPAETTEAPELSGYD